MKKPLACLTDFGFQDVEIERKVIEGAGAELRITQCRTPEATAEFCREADVVLVQWAPITAGVIQALERCRGIVRYGIGVDNIDLAAARIRGIRVANVPDYCLQEVADHAFALALAAIRQLPETDQRVRSGQWKITPPRTMPAIRRMTFATAGFGRIAREVLVRKAADFLGGLDVVICNAGICHFKAIMEVTDEDWLLHVNTNLNGTFYVAQEAAKIMITQGRGGRIIFTTSVGAFRSNATQTHYCATKGAQHLLMKGMALELGPYDITVNDVAPGWIHTDINDTFSRDPSVTEPWIKAHCPVGRLGSVEDLKGAYLLLASKDGAYINGSTITVDGGCLAQL